LKICICVIADITHAQTPLATNDAIKFPGGATQKGYKEG